VVYKLNNRVTARLYGLKSVRWHEDGSSRNTLGGAERNLKSEDPSS